MCNRSKENKLEHKEKTVWKTLERTLETYGTWEQSKIYIHIIIVPEREKTGMGQAQYLRIQWIFQTRWTSGHRVQMYYEPQAEYVLRNSHLGKSQKNCWKTKTKKISRTAKGKSKHYLPRNNSKTGSWLPNKTAKARMKWMTSSKYWNKVTANLEFYAQWKYSSKWRWNKEIFRPKLRIPTSRQAE